MESELLEFIQKIKDREIDLYNEYGIQFELALFLRSKGRLKDFKIELERPIGHFGIKKTVDIPKKEIDLCVYKKNGQGQEKYGIEIKFSNNGQVPLQMFKFCEDICFLEHLKKNGFKQCFSFVVVGSDNFIKPKTKNDGIYEYFRGDRIITGSVICPTGPDKGKVIIIENQYKPEWKTLSDSTYYYLLKI
jgi:hypothetical protein